MKQLIFFLSLRNYIRIIIFYIQIEAVTHKKNLNDRLRVRKFLISRVHHFLYTVFVRISGHRVVRG